MLTDSFVKTVKAAEGDKKYGDSGGMYLLVHKNGGKYWRMDFRFEEKRKTLALGTYPEITLALARKRRDEARKLIAEGIDPAQEKQQVKEKIKEEKTNTFSSVALEYVELKSKSTEARTNKKLRTQIENHLLEPLGDKNIAQIKPPEILKILKHVESMGTIYTATRLREILGQVFRYAIQTGRAESNPAESMRGAIARHVREHRPALTTRREFGKFVCDLLEARGADKLTRLAGVLAVLTWTRPGELRHAKWDELDINEKEWRIPAQRMKTGKNLQNHIVPLSDYAISVLAQIKEITGSFPYLFPARTSGKGVVMSENTINNLFRNIGYIGLQSHHGLRASARSLLSERGWSRDALERQLDHKESNLVVAAYARAEHLEERRKLMQDWGELVRSMAHSENVVPLNLKSA